MIILLAWGVHMGAGGAVAGGAEPPLKQQQGAGV